MCQRREEAKRRSATPLDNSPGHPPIDACPILRSKDVSATVLGPAGTDMCGFVIRRIAVVAGEFFACLHIPEGDNPEGALRCLHCTVGIAGVIDIPSGIREGLAVDIP